MRDRESEMDPHTKEGELSKVLFNEVLILSKDSYAEYEEYMDGIDRIIDLLEDPILNNSTFEGLVERNLEVIKSNPVLGHNFDAIMENSELVKEILIGSLKNYRDITNEEDRESYLFKIWSKKVLSKRV